MTATTAPLAAHNAALARSLGAAGLLDEARVRPLLTPAILEGLAARPRVTFGRKPVDNGAFFRAGECKQRPRVGVEEAPGAGSQDETAPSSSYLFMMVDPDAPSPDDYKFAYWRHLVVGGLRAHGGEHEEAEEEDGWADAKELTAYLGPGPKDESVPCFLFCSPHLSPTPFLLGSSYQVSLHGPSESWLPN